MKYIRLFSKLHSIVKMVLFVLAVFISSQTFADVSPSPMNSSIKTSPKIEEMKKLERPKSTGPTGPSQPLPEIKLPPRIQQRTDYLHPGILVNTGGRWEGSDHFFNLPSNIGVYITLIKPEQENLPISKEQLQKEVERIFTQGAIQPVTIAPADRPPLPAFEIEILIYPIDNRGYAVFFNGRLFESVTLERFRLDPGMAFQAITWEKQNLFVIPKDKLEELLMQSVQETAKTFVERYRSFNLKR